jgi:hypothetical protein
MFDLTTECVQHAHVWDIYPALEEVENKKKELQGRR